MTKRIHIGYAKRFIIECIRRDGAAAVLLNWTATDEEAIEAIKADPREVFVPDGCDNQGPDGRCLGHEVDPETVARRVRRETKELFR